MHQSLSILFLQKNLQSRKLLVLQGNRIKNESIKLNKRDFINLKKKFRIASTLKIPIYNNTIRRNRV